MATDSELASRDALASLRALVEDPTWTQTREDFGRETYPIHRVRALLPDDRAEFAQVLRQQLGRSDALAAMTIGEAPLPELTDALVALRGASGWFGTCVRRALASLGQGHTILGEWAQDLRSSQAFVRSAAAMALQQVGPPVDESTVRALLDLLTDRDALVAKSAFDALVAVTGLDACAWKPGSTEPELRAPLHRVRLLAGSELASLREPAQMALRDLFLRAWRGVPAIELNLLYTPRTDQSLFHRLGAALYNPAVAVPLAELLELTGHERTYAEALLAVALERCWVPSVAALAALGADWTVPALQEAMQLPCVDAEFVDAVTLALGVLAPGLGAIS